MPRPSTPLPLLGLADELSATEPTIGDPAAEAQLRHLLDRLVDALVDVAQGRTALSRPELPGQEVQDLPGTRRASAGSPDRAACSALASRCHRAAVLLSRHDDQRLAGHLVACLDILSSGLQRLVQESPTEVPAEARQRLRRALRQAGAVLDDAAP
jgi:hypothetical protein